MPHVGIITATGVLNRMPPPPSAQAMPTQAMHDLTIAVQQLTLQLNHPIVQSGYGWWGWTVPATHFIDTLPDYNPLPLSLVLLATVFLLGILVAAWITHKRLNHQSEIAKSMMVPLEAFTAVVTQHAASLELLGQRMEAMTEQMNEFTQGIHRFSAAFEQTQAHEIAPHGVSASRYGKPADMRQSSMS